MENQHFLGPVVVATHTRPLAPKSDSKTKWKYVASMFYGPSHCCDVASCADPGGAGWAGWPALPGPAGLSWLEGGAGLADWAGRAGWAGWLAGLAWAAWAAGPAG